MELRPLELENENGDFVKGTLVVARLFDEISPRMARKLAENSIYYQIGQSEITIHSLQNIQEVHKLLFSSVLKKYVFHEAAYLRETEEVVVSEKYL